MALPPDYVPRPLGLGKDAGLSGYTGPASSGLPSRTSPYGAGPSATGQPYVPKRLGMTPEENARASIENRKRAGIAQAGQGGFYDMRNSSDPSNQYGFSPEAPRWENGLGDGTRGGNEYSGDFDQRAPGAAEKFFSDNLNRYQAGPQGQTNYAADAYNSFLQGSAPNLDPYYNNAKRRAAEELNQQFAARGAYGSSVALDRLGEAMTDLNAQQADREADYAMKRYELGGNLGMSADSMARQNSEGYLNWLDSGMNAANLAQASRRLRGRDYMDDMTGAFSGLSDIAGKQYDQLFQDDQSLLDAQLAMNTGLGAEYLSQAQRKEDQFRQDADTALSFWSMLK